MVGELRPGSSKLVESVTTDRLGAEGSRFSRPITTQPSSSFRPLELPSQSVTQSFVFFCTHQDIRHSKVLGTSILRCEPDMVGTWISGTDDISGKSLDTLMITQVEILRVPALRFRIPE